MEPVNGPAKFEVRSFTRSWDNNGYLKTLGSPWTCPRSLVSKIFNGFFVRMDPVSVNAATKFEVCSFTHSRDNSDWSFGWVANPQSWGRGGRRGSGMVPFERALVTSYRPSIVTFPVSLSVWEILLHAFVLKHATFSHRTSSLTQISPCSPGSNWMAFGLRRAKMLG